MRRESGVGNILMCAMALLVLLPLGLTTFEVWRYVIARAQLQYICDAAALAATATMLKPESPFAANNINAINNANSTASPNSNRENAAKDAARFTFRENTILGAPMQNVQITGGQLATPLAGKVSVRFQVIRENDTLGTPRIKGVRLSSVYGYKALSSQYLGLGAIPLSVASEGGIPIIDLVLCFDVSASMDDGTAVTAVKRYWDGNAVAYNIPTAASGKLVDVARPVGDGSKVNAVGPQNLSVLATAKNNSLIAFSESPGSAVRGLRALGGSQQTSEAGRPPGNYSAASPSQSTGNGIDAQAQPNAVTDLIVNLDGKNNFAGWVDPATGLQFPNVETLVEAARGNLDSQSAMQAALVSGRPAWLPATAPNPLYQRVYLSRANKMTQPMAAGKTAAIQILRALDASTDLHSGLVSFSDGIGYDSATEWGNQEGGNTYFIDSNWPAGGKGVFPLPLLRLEAGQANVVGKLPSLLNLDRWLCSPAYAQALPTQSVVQLVSHLVATGKSNLSAALTEAVAELSDPACTRPDAEKVILVISDGKPSLPGGGGGAESAAAQACYAQAGSARNEGIRIFTININPAADAESTTFLQKLADLSRGYYAPGTSDADLNLALRKMVTQLVALR